MVTAQSSGPSASSHQGFRVFDSPRPPGAISMTFCVPERPGDLQHHTRSLFIGRFMGRLAQDSMGVLSCLTDLSLASRPFCSPAWCCWALLSDWLEKEILTTFWQLHLPLSCWSATCGPDDASAEGERHES